MTTVLDILCMVTGFAILAYRLAAAVAGRRDGTMLPFCLYVGCSATSYLVLLPPVYAAIDRRTGMSNSAGLCSGVCVLGLTAAQQYLLVHWTYPPEMARVRSARRLYLIGVMSVAYVAAYLVFEPRQQRFGDFYLHYSHQLFGAPYLIIYIAACLIGQLDVVRHCRRYARAANRAWLRRGMWLTALGGSVILIYCVIRIADLVAGPLGFDLRGVEPLAWTCGDVGSALALVGWVLPLLGPRLTTVGRWWRTWWDFHRLYRLWATLYREAPAVVLGPRPSSRLADLARVRNLDFWLHRRVIEIQDAWRLLGLAPEPNDPVEDWDAEIRRLREFSRTALRPPNC